MSVFLLMMQAGVAALSPAPCVSLKSEASHSSELRIACGEKQIEFTSSGTTETAQNEATGSVAVAVHDDEDPRIFIVRPAIDSPAVIDDLTDTLASSAGRAPRERLAGLAIDLSSFAKEGVVTISDLKSDERLTQYSVNTLIAGELALRSKPSERLPVVEVTAVGRGPRMSEDSHTSSATAAGSSTSVTP